MLNSFAKQITRNFVSKPSAIICSAKDILIACVDGLSGFPEAINAIYPETEVQLCIVHQIRNSFKYVGSKHQKEFIPKDRGRP